MIDRNAILAAYNFRHACKEFDPDKKISAEDFDFILETGRLSPSSFGFEPWQFVVIQNPDLREKLRGVTWGAQKQLPTSSHYLAILVRKDGMRYDGGHVAHMIRDIQKLPEDKMAMKLAKFQQFQESDFKLLDEAHGVEDWAGKQAYIALGNMMTAAAMIGIDSCPVEGFDKEAAEHVLADAGALDRNEFGLAVMVAFGYRKNPASAKTRQTPAEVVRWVD